MNNAAQLLDMPVMKKKMKKVKDMEVEDISILLKTIKLTKNINYLTEKLPKPNYSPLRYKSLLSNRSSMDHKKGRLSDLHEMSLPPIKGVNPRQIIKSDRSLVGVKRKRVSNNEESLPKLAGKQRQRSKAYLY